MAQQLPRTSSSVFKELSSICGEASSPYAERVRLIHRLPSNLAPEQLERCRAFLESTLAGQPLPDLEFNGLKNELVFALLRQRESLTELAGLLVRMSRAPDTDATWRDYCVQFLGKCYPRINDTRSREAMADALWEALRTRRRGRAAGSAARQLMTLGRTFPEFPPEKVSAASLEAPLAPAASEETMTALLQVAGRTVSRTFDALNRRTGLSLGTDISANYAYDGLGRVSSIASGVNAVAFDYRTHGTELAGKHWSRNGNEVASTAATYDAWGNVTGISFGAPGNLHSLGYLHDLADRRTQASLPDGTRWLYGYDRLSQVVSGERVAADTGAPVSGGSFRYAYDGIGSRVSSRDGSAAATRRYTANPLNQYTAIAGDGGIPIRGRADADATVAVTVTVGGRTTIYRPARDGQAFSVDIPVDSSAGAVTAHVAVDAVRRDGTLDADLHRRLSGDYTVPAATAVTPAYDADGNMLSCGGWAYTWNGEDRLASATRGTTRLEFRYDYLGRRFEKRVYESNTLTRHQLFVYDGFKQIAEYDALSSNALARTYVWQPIGLDVPLLRNGQEFYIADANKNIVALIDASGAVTDTYVYDPFGTCTHIGDSDNPFRFSSEYYDGETGLIYYNFRYYSSALGRWLSRDPKADGKIFKNSLLSFLLSGSVANMEVLLLLSEENEIDINRFIYTFSKNCPTIIIDYHGLDTRGWDWISCMASCIEDNDPIKLAIAKALLLIGGASIPKETVALLAESVGDIELARKIRMSLKIPGISRYTTIPSALSAKLRMGGRSSLRAFGRFANQVLIGYGLALSAVEAHCTGHCCGLRHYDPSIGNIMSQLESFF